MNRRTFILLSAISVNLMACCCGGVPVNTNPAPANAQAVVPETPEELIVRFGKPDDDYSSEIEVPRPLILTRLIEYKKHGVRAVFIPHAQHRGNEIPVREWSVLGFIDIPTNTAITADEAMNRLSRR